MVVQVFQESLLFSLLISHSIWQQKRHKPQHLTIKFKFTKSMSIYLERDEIAQFS